MGNKRNILFMSPWYPDKKDPMPGLFVQRHALAAAQLNEVSCLYVKGYADQETTELEWTQNPLVELRIYYPSRAGFVGWIKYRYAFLHYHFKGLALVTKKWGRRPDLVHVNILTREGVIALLWKWLYGIPYVVTEHWSRYHNGGFSGFFKVFLTRLVVKHASAILPVTKHLQTAMEACGLKNSNYLPLPNVVDTDFFVPGPSVDLSGKQILHISCFQDESKNIKGIIDTLVVLRKKRTDFKMVFVGDGIDYKWLKTYANEQQVSDPFMEFRGLLEGDQLLKEIQKSTFHLMFSRYENLPVVNLECMSCGLPILSSDVGGIKEHLGPDLGVLVPSESQTALEEGIIDILDNNVLFDAVHIREYAVANFSMSELGKRLNNIYQEAIGSMLEK